MDTNMKIEWLRMADLIPEGSCGTAKIVTHAQLDLVEIVHPPHQVVCVKGGKDR
jgi:hypothetical protein